MSNEELDRAEQSFREEMANKPDRYDWLDVAYKVALQQGNGHVSTSLWAEFVERVRPR